MRHFDRGEAESSHHADIFDWLDIDQRRITVLAFEYVIEAAFETGHHRRARQARQRVAARIAHDAQIIDAMAVIGVVVRPQHGVDPVDPIGQKLVSQIG